MTNSVLEAIASRRSVRGYQKEQITLEQREALITAALQSPSAMDQQPWHFSVVQSRELLDELNAAAREQALKEPASYAAMRFGQPGYDVFYGAPTVFFLSLDKDAPNGQYVDAGIAAENLALAAVGLGLGSVILGLPRGAFSSERGDEFRMRLNFPEHYDFAIAVAVGNGTVTKDAHVYKPGRVSVIV
jgi:nitroreductase